MRYKITIEYNGYGFCGWQKQKEKLSIQEVVENAIYKALNQKVELIVAGRTDAGVHALGQVAHFDVEIKLQDFQVVNAINFYLKSHIVTIIDIEKVSNNFSARLSAIERHYQYRILNRTPPIALEKNFYWQIFQKLDIEKMREAAKFLVGKHNFNSFRSSACQAKNAIRTINSIQVKKEVDKIFIDIYAKSFLHNQVRIIVGTLVEIGKEKNLDIKDILLKKDRRYASATAHAYGLYLMSIKY